MGSYPKVPYVVGDDVAILHCERTVCKKVKIRRNLPGNIIVIHGVNDVGVSYKAVEHGLCAGLAARLGRPFTPASYRMPVAADKDKLEDDPDAVFFKRTIAKDTNSPVIPFYWGYREAGEKCRTVNGQFVDRYGNRLDKDLSKEGGPFGNATSSLPDMWRPGMYAPADPMGDALRPLRTAPGRMYMVLAAQRLAALISMIRDYDAQDTVSIVAHSQGCLLSLLAQAMLMEKGLAPADNLILTHPPYSLVDSLPLLMRGAAWFDGGEDAAMKPYYHLLSGTQTLGARLKTLANIVAGVAKGSGQACQPPFADLKKDEHRGMVGNRWQSADDRDNRRKVYLYFCPEDMTVALDNIQGIGWDGVPDHALGSELVEEEETSSLDGYSISSGHTKMVEHKQVRGALAELGGRFYQRVFSEKTRLDPATGKTTVSLVGKPPPFDFPLRLPTETEQSHVEVSLRKHRAQHQAVAWPVNTSLSKIAQRNGIRTITGEVLKQPVAADLRGTSQIEPANIPVTSMMRNRPVADQGPAEDVDPCDASVALTSGTGMQLRSEYRPDPGGYQKFPERVEHLTPRELALMTASYNKEKGLDMKDKLDQREIVSAQRYPDSNVVAKIQESPNEARLRWQREVSAKSFHSSIIGSTKNHSQVTAYDVAIGSGKASSDPLFYAYLCAVADWRVKISYESGKRRPGILLWSEFLENFRTYFDVENSWRKNVIKGNISYYNSGVLPADLPLLIGPLWKIVISETKSGKKTSDVKKSKT
ncbi:T6SS effector phospholipase Tle3 domain-containing protein [Janthinobacterium sp. LB3P112]|uniref:T6SS effector phospholipase Tle3 domain-containing protein n=1 Tax=Janthinobacterium sp. LB3P112 TaxID=3424196 RepID=UPI003F2052B6